jgi:hypothetical protein
VTAALRVFVDERPMEVPPGCTVLAAVAAFSTEVADAIREGTAYVTDGVGRSTDPSKQVSQGEILRIVRTVER